MIRIISFVLIITVYCVNVNSDRIETDESVTLNSLEDIEVLTYFLLWKYNYFQNNNYKVDETQFNSRDDSFKDISKDSDINESKLRLFIENLKDNKLIQHITNSSSSLTSKDNTIKSCNNIDHILLKKWQNNMSPNKIKVLLQILIQKLLPIKIFLFIRITFFYLNSTKRIYVRPRPVVSHPNN